MKKYQVFASYKVILVAEVEAEDEHEAYDKAKEFDGSEFEQVAEDSLGGWSIDEVLEVS
jgi:hypothetical protein